MDHFVEKLKIKNFKSIRDLTLTDFRRINLFIGRPNVGKSNLLEALGMFTIEFFRFYHEKVGRDLVKDCLRVDTTSNLFYDGSVENDIFIHFFSEKFGGENCRVSFDSETLQLSYGGKDYKSNFSISNKFDLRLFI